MTAPAAVPGTGPGTATGVSPGRPAILVLEDGRTFTGTAFGADGETFGEMVFSTGMTGYQETLTDPSYCGQIVAMTAPHIGNTGVNDEDPESRRIWVSGYVIREPSRIASNWRSARTLEAELCAQGITGIAITGTRALTRHLRERGAMRGAISTTTADPAQLLRRVLASPSMAGADLVREVSAPTGYTVDPPPGTPVRFTVAAVDLGIKAATPRQLAALGCRVHVLPATSTAADILACGPDGTGQDGTGPDGPGQDGTGQDGTSPDRTGPDGVFFSNGPGDPAALDYCVDAMRGVLASGVPVFGICLGSQILGRALGLGTYKLRFGHRGVNQPVQDLRTGRVQITSHNHGFALAMPSARGPGTALAPSLPFDTDFGPAVITHLNLNDGVVEGLRLLDAPAFAVQYHPEAAPGPHDAAGLFGEFCELMQQGRGHHAEAR